MFENCNTLAELNAARISMTNSGAELIDVNNAYNKRRQEILSERANFVKLTPIVVKAREVTRYCGIPLAGRTTEKGTIQFSAKGFLY